MHKMKQFLLIFALCAALATAEPSKPNTRIGNGEDAVAGQFPWQAMILLNSVTVCNGALIHPSYVVTEAGCVASSLVEWVDIRLGALTFDDYELQINATQFIIHEDYNETTLTNPIALIYLGESVQLSDNIQVIQLAVEDIEAAVTVTASGFGDNAYLEGEGVLRFAEVQTITNDACALIYGDIVHDEIVCTFSPEERSLCLSDVGAPLVQDADTPNAALVGLLTFIGSYDCPNPYPAGFVRISKNVDWINKNINSTRTFV